MLNLFAVRDSKAEAFMPPFTATNKGLAIRSFTDAVNDKSSIFSKYPDDFVLYDLGTFDESTGIITSSDVLAPVITARECLNSEV